MEGQILCLREFHTAPIGKKKKILLDNNKTKVLKVKQQCQGKFEN